MEPGSGPDAGPDRVEYLLRQGHRPFVAPITRRLHGGIQDRAEIDPPRIIGRQGIDGLTGLLDHPDDLAYPAGLLFRGPGVTTRQGVFTHGQPTLGATQQGVDTLHALPEQLPRSDLLGRLQGLAGIAHLLGRRQARAGAQKERDKEWKQNFFFF